MEPYDPWVSYREAFGRYGAIRGFYFHRSTQQMTEQGPGDVPTDEQDIVLVRPRRDGVFQFRMSSVQGVLRADTLNYAHSCNTCALPVV